MGILDDLANAFGEGIKFFSEQIAKSDEKILTSYFDMRVQCLESAEKSVLSGKRGVDTEQVKIAENYGRSLPPEQYERLQQLLVSKQMQDYEKKMEQLQAEAIQRRKPDVLCPPECYVDSVHCQECRLKQKSILEAMYQLESIEKAINDPSAEQVSMADMTKGVKCCMCGAPIRALEDECPYCGMSFSPVFTMKKTGLPATSLERERLMLNEAAKVYELFIEFGDYLEEAGKSKTEERIAMAPACMQKYVRRLRQFILNIRVMGPTEISKGARYYNISVSEYIGSIIAGGTNGKGILPWYGICTNENNQITVEQTEKEKEINRKNHEIQMAAMRKRHEIQMETMKRQEKLLLSKTPKYQPGGGGGGYLGSKCCGNCVSYMPEQNKCARDTYKRISGAGDYCAYHHYK